VRLLSLIGYLSVDAIWLAFDESPKRMEATQSFKAGERKERRGTSSCRKASQTPYARQSDWIFASSRLRGRQPRTASILAADHLRPAAIAAGVVLKPGQRFGFHNLRHSLATFLISKENDTKTVQGLLRHANVSTTLGLYAQSVNSSMVEAQESMLKAILRNGSNVVN
jgi:integrase